MCFYYDFAYDELVLRRLLLAIDFLPLLGFLMIFNDEVRSESVYLFVLGFGFDLEGRLNVV